MGICSVEAAVSAGSAARARVTFMVDSGAIYSVLPERAWQALGLVPTRTIELALVDGTTISRGVSECRFHYRGIDAWSPVVLGGPNDVALLGAVTLECMGLVLNPLERTLQPARLRLGMIAAAGAGTVVMPPSVPPSR
jgi:predicted aspartyl protease